MIIPDINLLMYAYNSSLKPHRQAASWWESCLSGSEKVGLIYPVLFGFLRIATNKRILPNPMSLSEAVSCIVSWQQRSVTVTLSPGPQYLEDTVRLLSEAGSSGANLVTDAQIGAYALHYRAVVHTADYDFLRFREVTAHFPLRAGSAK
jgi:uncharacterized protein